MEPEPETSVVARGAQQSARPTGVMAACKTDREDGELGCAHYRRKCQLVAPCCSDAFWCRHCHNEQKYDGVLDPKFAHQLDRTKVVEVVCAACQERQPVAAACRVCANQFGKYFCANCR
jgi:RING finger and CHY zinc finger domain-containing protein 1